MWSLFYSHNSDQNSRIFTFSHTVSNVGDIPKVELSCLEKISEPAEILTIKGVLESLAEIVEYSGKPDIEDNDLKKCIAISSDPANIPAIEYASLEVLSNSNNNALSLECTDYPLFLRL